MVFKELVDVQSEEVSDVADSYEYNLRRSTRRIA
jgi:hypothetical protein